MIVSHGIGGPGFPEASIRAVPVQFPPKPASSPSPNIDKVYSKVMKGATDVYGREAASKAFQAEATGKQRKFKVRLDEGRVTHFVRKTFGKLRKMGSPGHKIAGRHGTGSKSEESAAHGLAGVGSAIGTMVTAVFDFTMSIVNLSRAVKEGKHGQRMEKEADQMNAVFERLEKGEYSIKIVDLAERLASEAKRLTLSKELFTEAEKLEKLADQADDSRYLELLQQTARVKKHLAQQIQSGANLDKVLSILGASSSSAALGVKSVFFLEATAVAAVSLQAASIAGLAGAGLVVPLLAISLVDHAITLRKASSLLEKVSGQRAEVTNLLEERERIEPALKENAKTLYAELKKEKITKVPDYLHFKLPEEGLDRLQNIQRLLDYASRKLGDSKQDHAAEVAKNVSFGAAVIAGGISALTFGYGSPAALASGAVAVGAAATFFAGKYYLHRSRLKRRKLMMKEAEEKLTPQQREDLKVYQTMQKEQKARLKELAVDRRTLGKQARQNLKGRIKLLKAAGEKVDKKALKGEVYEACREKFAEIEKEAFFCKCVLEEARYCGSLYMDTKTFLRFAVKTLSEERARGVKAMPKGEQPLSLTTASFTDLFCSMMMTPDDRFSADDFVSAFIMDSSFRQRRWRTIFR